MSHQPFEDWLLNDRPLTPTEKCDLDAHIRTCKYCSALAETRAELRLVRTISPKSGFADRFKKRLAARRIVDRRRRIWSPIVFLLGGAALLLWLTALMQFAGTWKIELVKAVAAS
jgi:hypothetical protein